MIRSNGDVVNLAPLFLACSITEMVRSPIRPNMFGNLLPRYLRRLVHVHAGIGQRAVSVVAFRVNGDGLAKESDL